MAIGRWLAGLGLAFVVSTASAQTAPTPAAQAEAQSAVIKRIDLALTGKGQLPRLSDAVDGPLLRTAFDYRTLSGRNLFEDENGLSYCEQALVTSQAYYTAGTDVSLANIQSQSAEQQQATGANSKRYHDELALGFGYMLECFAGFIAPAQDLWDSLEPAVRAEARDSVVMVRDGSLGMFKSTIEMMAEARYTLANKTEMLAALRRNQDVYAAALSPTQRIKVLNTIDLATPKAPLSLRAEMGALRKAFDIKTCQGLCAA